MEEPVLAPALLAALVVVETASSASGVELELDERAPLSAGLTIGALGLKPGGAGAEMKAWRQMP